MKDIRNKNEALDTVSIDGMKLEECSSDLRNDKDVVIAAVRNREKAMMFVSEKLKCDKDVIRSALVRKSTLRSEEGIAFSFLPEKIKDNEIIVLMSIPIFGGAFQYISERLKQDEDFLVDAALVNNQILKYIDSKYLRDKKFIKRILNRISKYVFPGSKKIARFLDSSILDNEHMMKEIILKSGFENFKYASSRLKEKRDFIFEIISVEPKIYELLPHKFYSDKEITLEAVRNNGMYLRLAFWSLQEDKEIVLEAVKNNPYSLQFADDKLQKDKELLSYVTKDDRYYYSLVNPRNGFRYEVPMLMSDDPEYFDRYVNYMRMKEQSPSTFEKILRWD